VNVSVNSILFPSIRKGPVSRGAGVLLVFFSDFENHSERNIYDNSDNNQNNHLFLLLRGGIIGSAKAGK
jgi:hypothetical protein